MTDVQVHTSREAAAIALAGYSELRDEIRGWAHHASGDENRPVRDALLRVVFRMDGWRDEMCGRLGVDSPAGPPRPALADVDIPRGSEEQMNRAAANAKASKFRGRHERRAS